MERQTKRADEDGILPKGTDEDEDFRVDRQTTRADEDDIVLKGTEEDEDVQVWNKMVREKYLLTIIFSGRLLFFFI